AMQQRLADAGGEKQGVKRRHHPVMPLANLDGTASERAPGVASREGQLGQPLQRQEAQEAEIDHHLSSTSSEQKPGPMAKSSPRSPARASPESSSSRSTNSTDADDRLPVFSSESHDRCSAVCGSESASANACSTLGPPVWATKCWMRERSSPCAARK